MAYGDNYRQLIRPASLRKERNYYNTRADDGKFSESPGGGGGGGSKEKPKKDSRTPQEIANQNRAKVAEETGLGSDLDGAMARLNAGMGGVKDEEKAQALVDKGLATYDADTGRFRLSPEGKKFYAAGKKGDVEAAKNVMAAAQAKADAKKEKAKAKEDKAKAKEEAAEAKEKAEAEEEKKPKGGGGGGGGSKKPSEDEKAKAKDEAKEKAAQDAAAKAGIKPETLDAMRAAADGAGVDPKAAKSLIAAGLMEDSEDGPILSAAGQKTLASLERGDARGAIAAMQQAKSKQRQTYMREQKMLKRAGLPYGFDAYSLVKHVHHNRDHRGYGKAI